MWNLRQLARKGRQDRSLLFPETQSRQVRTAGTRFVCWVHPYHFPTQASSSKSRLNVHGQCAVCGLLSSLAGDRLTLTQAHSGPNFLLLDSFTEHSDIIGERVLQHCILFILVFNKQV